MLSWEKPLVKHMVPGSLSYYITSLFYFIVSRLLFFNLYFPIYISKIPKIVTLLALLDLTFASDREGIDDPFITLVARFLIVCAGTRWLVCRLLLDWYLGSQNRGKYLRYFAASPFPLQGKTNTCSRGITTQLWHVGQTRHEMSTPYNLA